MGMRFRENVVVFNVVVLVVVEGVVVGVVVVVVTVVVCVESAKVVGANVSIGS